MNEEAFGALKKEAIGEPLVGLLFGEPIALIAIAIDQPSWITALSEEAKKSAHEQHSISPDLHILDEWWDSIVSAAWKRRWPDAPH